MLTRAWSLESFLANRRVVANAALLFKLHKIARKKFLKKELARELVL
jgi:hypothetical protein